MCLASIVVLITVKAQPDNLLGVSGRSLGCTICDPGGIGSWASIEDMCEKQCFPQDAVTHKSPAESDRVWKLRFTSSRG